MFFLSVFVGCVARFILVLSVWYLPNAFFCSVFVVIVAIGFDDFRFCVSSLRVRRTVGDLDGHGATWFQHFFSSWLASWNHGKAPHEKVCHNPPSPGKYRRVRFAAVNSVSYVAPSLGAWLGYTSTAAAASGAGTVGAFSAVSGAAGAGVAGYKMTRRTAGVSGTPHHCCRRFFFCSALFFFFRKYACNQRETSRSR